jgi:hypothetical protein
MFGHSWAATKLSRQLVAVRFNLFSKTELEAQMRGVQSPYKPLELDTGIRKKQDDIPHWAAPLLL